MQVTIDKPFQLELDVIAADEHRVQQFRHSLKYRGSMWFECSCWETFVSSLNDGEARAATLTDMDGCFVLAAKAACRFPADLDTLAYIERQFTSFPQWW